MAPRITDEPSLHLCMRPLGYVTPYVFPKLFYQAFMGSRSPSSVLDYCESLLRSTRAICERCGAIFRVTIWSRTELRWFYELAQISDGSESDKRMDRDCGEKRLTCPHCGLTTGLADIGLPLFEDVTTTGPAPDPADDVPAASE